MIRRPETAQIAAYLEQRLPQYLSLLQQMVAINSFTTNVAGVNQLGELTAAVFAELGLSAEPVASANPAHGRHLLLARPGAAGPQVGLVSHLDTVFPPEEERAKDFAWRVEGDRIYGPGTVDIKGGTLMIYAVLDALRALAPEVFAAVRWTVLLNAAEEVLSPDFGQLCLERLDGALACLVFEIGRVAQRRCVLVAGRGGRATYHVTAHGRGAHSGNDHARGANAIVQLAQTVQRLAALTSYERGLTCNVGVIRGGTLPNRVPHEASAEAELRAARPESFQQGHAAVLALAGAGDVASAADGYRCRVEVEVLGMVPAWPRNDATERLIGLWRAQAESLGMGIDVEVRGGLSDGNWTCARIPTLDGLGPSGGNMHSSERSADGSKDQEFIDVASFVPKALLNVLGILALVEPAI